MSTDLEQRFCEGGWSEQNDCVPLRLRLKMLRTKVSKQECEDAAATGVANVDNKLIYDEKFGDQKEDRDSTDEVIQIGEQSGPVKVSTTSGFPNHRAQNFGPHASPVDISSNFVDYHGKSLLDRTSGVSGTYSAEAPPSEVVSEEKRNCVDVFVPQSTTEVFYSVPRDCSVVLSSVHIEDKKLNHETVYGFHDDLENLVLGERRRLLISRKLTQPCGSHILERNELEEMSNSSKVAMLTADTVKQEFDFIRYTLTAENTSPLSSAHDHLDSKSRCDITSNGNSVPLSSELRASSTVEKCKSFSIQEFNSTNASPMIGSVLPSLAKVKDEPVDTSDIGNQGKSGMQAFDFGSEMLALKSEPASFDSLGDELDHLPLTDRIKLLSSGTLKPSMDTLDNLEFSKDSVGVSSGFLESVQPISVSRPLKRKRTATDSVETALEEDAPGLLKVLIEKGVLVDEMKLYGEETVDGDLDDTFSEDGFAELEAVISQLFSQRQTFIKLSHLRTKGTKVSYCLACLLSLVEQTRYLRNRNWPVEWGWCRDLQSFIFVFRRHNRIVLERPEYGYATYFFELLDSVPAAWQIKRLVTAMKLTSCGRVTLIENKPLMVGDDLSEGEARVLAEYGWTPNTGLGTMLNYCDRVVHDRRHEMDNSEWRSKIVKQLMNGYNGGNIVCKFLPKKMTELQRFEEDSDVQVKLEQ